MRMIGLKPLPPPEESHKTQRFTGSLLLTTAGQKQDRGGSKKHRKGKGYLMAHPSAVSFLQRIQSRAP